MDAITPLPVSAPIDDAPVCVAEGIWWARLPLDETATHVNVYVLENADTITLVDCGTNTAECIASLERLLVRPEFRGKPLSDVIVTHHHPDHIGLAGMLSARGVKLITTRTSWLSAMLLQNTAPQPDAAAIEFFTLHGMPAIEVEAFRRRSPNSRYTRLVQPPPLSYQSIGEGATLERAGRMWNVYVGGGHSAEHATLWSNDNVAIVGDQIIAGISPSLNLHPSEPDADLVGEWIASNQKFAQLAHDSTLCLPGHNIPFYGISVRCQQQTESQNIIVNRLMESLNRPKTTIACIDAVNAEANTFGEREVQVLKTAAYLNHLLARQMVTRELWNGNFLWIRNE